MKPNRALQLHTETLRDLGMQEASRLKGGFKNFWNEGNLQQMSIIIETQGCVTRGPECA